MIMNHIENFKGTVILKNGEKHEFSDEKTYKQFVVENIDNIISTNMSTTVESIGKDNNEQGTEPQVGQKETSKNLDIKALKAFRENLNEGLIALINKAGDKNVEYDSILNLCETLGLRLESILQKYLRETHKHFPADTKFIEGDLPSTIQDYIKSVSNKIDCLDEEYDKYVDKYNHERDALANALSKYYAIFGFVGGVKSMTSDYVSNKKSEYGSDALVKTEVIETKPTQVSEISGVMGNKESYEDFVSWIDKLLENHTLPNNSASNIVNFPKGYRKLFNEIFHDK